MTLVEITRPSESVALLTLQRPEKKNALSIALRDEVTEALGALAADESVKAVVVTGAGAVFSAGFDLEEFQSFEEEHQRRLWASSDRFHHACLTFPLPLIAAVNGPALAGGFDLAVMCDVRIAAESARFAHPEHTFGDVVYGPLHDLVGGAVARDLALSGRSVDAGEALRLRLVTNVVPDGEALDAALRYATAVAAAPRAILLRTKAKIVARAAIALGPTLEL
jgi:enoyl-CoA hydratase